MSPEQLRCRDRIRTANVGDHVAWTMMDGHTMAGTVTSVGLPYAGYAVLDVQRVDGGFCAVDTARKPVRLATVADMEAARAFFTR